MKKNTTVYLIAGGLISALALYLAFRNVPLSELIIYLTAIRYFWLLPSSLVIVIVFALRAYRWQIILESARRVTFWQSFHPLMIGFTINCLLPGRVGELARPAILQKKEKIPFSTGLATVAAERVFDVTILIVFFAILLATVNIDPDLDITFGNYHLNRQILMIASRKVLLLLLVLMTGIIMAAFGKTRRLINHGIMAIPNLFWGTGEAFKNNILKRICIPLVAFVDNFASGFALVKYPKKIYICIGLSVIIWGLSAFSFYIVALGCPGIELSLLEIAAVMVITCFFIALPSVPGFWGIWEAGGVFALTLFGIPAKDAAGYTLVNHAVQIFTVMAIGMVSAMLTGVNIWRISHKNGNT